MRIIDRNIRIIPVVYFFLSSFLHVGQLFIDLSVQEDSFLAGKFGLQSLLDQGSHYRDIMSILRQY